MNSQLSVLSGGGSDLAAIRHLPQREQDYILRNLEVFAAIERAPAVVAECKRQARLCSAAGIEGGWSWKRIYARYQDWRKAGRCWRAITRQWNNGRDQRLLPNETVAHWRAEWARARGRSDTARATYARLTQAWLAGEEIPGLGTIYQWWARENPGLPMPQLSRIPRPELLPRGWSQTSFYEAVKPRCKAAAKLIQFGSFAAHSDWAAQVLRDRSRLRPFEIILFDDVRFDKQVLAQGEDGKWQSVYPVGLVAIDLATGCDLGLTLMPRLQREEGGHHGITRDGLRLLVWQLLSTYGLAPWPMRLVVEKAAAAMSGPDQAYLREAFGGRIEIKETEMQDFARLQGGLKERHGTPWSKAWIESYFRPLQTAIAHLEGSTGNRYDNTPGELGALVKESVALAERARGLGIDAAALKGRLLTFDEFHDAALSAMEILRWRTNHNLQGFDEVFEARLPDGSYRMIEDAAEVPADALAITSRPEAPVERMRRLVAGAQFEQVSPALLYPFLNDKLPVKIRQGRITVRNKRLQRKAGTPGDPLVYWQGGHEFLAEDRLWDQPLDGYFSADLSILHLVKEGAYLGSVQRWQRTDLTDPDSLAEAAGDVAHARNAILADLRRDYLGPQEAERAAANEHNARLLARPERDALGAPMASAESAAKQQRRRENAIRRANFETDALLADVPAEETTTTDDLDPNDLLS